MCIFTCNFVLPLQLWYADDCNSGLERHPGLRDQPGTGVQRRRRDRGDLAVPGGALVGVHASNGALVRLDAGTSIDHPFSVPTNALHLSLNCLD